MSDKTRALAEEYVSGYRRNTEMSNWDAVIEIGLKLAQEVLAEPVNAARTAQSAPLERDDLVDRLKRSIPDIDKKLAYKSPFGTEKAKMSYADAGGNYVVIGDNNYVAGIVPIPNDEEIELARGSKFATAVRSLCMRTGCKNQAGRAALEPYRKF